MRDMTNKVLLVIIASGNAVVGLWASFAPRSFYDTFPGGGHAWVAADGPFNQHLVRDVGTLNLALMAVAVAALVRPSRYLLQVVCGAVLIYAAPHLLYHATHLDPYDSSDKVALIGSLSVSVVAPIVLLLRSSRAPDGAITKVA